MISLHDRVEFIRAAQAANPFLNVMSPEFIKEVRWECECGLEQARNACWRVHLLDAVQEAEDMLDIKWILKSIIEETIK